METLGSDVFYVFSCHKAVRHYARGIVSMTMSTTVSVGMQRVEWFSRLVE